MKIDGLDRRGNHEIGFQALDLCVKRGLALDQLLGRQHAPDHEIDHPLQLAAPFFQLALDPASIARSFEGEPAALGDIGLDIEGHGLWIGELLAQAINHGALDYRQGVFLRVIACARLAGTRATDARLADLRLPVHGHAPAAATAAQKPRQHSRPARRIFLDCALAPFQAGSDSLDRLGVYDPQVFHLGDLPLAFRIEAADPLPCLGIADHANAVPDDLAGVDRRADHPVLALRRAVDGRGIPDRAARRRNPFPIERPRDLARRLAGGEVTENAANDLGLFRFDHKLARLAEDRPVAIGAPAGREAVADAACHASPGLVLEIFQIDRADQATDAYLHHVGLAVMDGDDIDPTEFQALVDCGHVLLIAGNAIEGFDHDDLESAGLGVGEQPHQAVALDHGRA